MLAFNSRLRPSLTARQVVIRIKLALVEPFDKLFVHVIEIRVLVALEQRGNLTQSKNSIKWLLTAELCVKALHDVSVGAAHHMVAVTIFHDLLTLEQKKQPLLLAHNG